MKKDAKEELSLKYDYQHCKVYVNRLQQGIKTTENVWNKYLAHVEDLITSGKIKDQDVIAIENRIEVLNQHWKKFKKAWNFEIPKQEVRRDYDLFNPNPNQQYSVNKLIPYAMQKQELDCFAKKITELHHKVQKFAYPCWLDRLYQFIKTSLLKLYNSFIAGPKNLSSENVYLVATQYGPGQTVMMPSYRPKKYNYFICYEKLKHNTAILKEDHDTIENFQKNARLDSVSAKR
ncbi:MAG: hypothetical protein WAL30_03510 [Candidatus Aquirickettsiella sp.]